MSVATTTSVTTNNNKRKFEAIAFPGDNELSKRIKQVNGEKDMAKSFTMRWYDNTPRNYTYLDTVMDTLKNDDLYRETIASTIMELDDENAKEVVRKHSAQEFPLWTTSIVDDPEHYNVSSTPINNDDGMHEDFHHDEEHVSTFEDDQLPTTQLEVADISPEAPTTTSCPPLQLEDATSIPTSSFLSQLEDTAPSPPLPFPSQLEDATPSPPLVATTTQTTQACPPSSLSFLSQLEDTTPSPPPVATPLEITTISPEAVPLNMQKKRRKPKVRKSITNPKLKFLSDLDLSHIHFHKGTFHGQIQIGKKQFKKVLSIKCHKDPKSTIDEYNRAATYINECIINKTLKTIGFDEANNITQSSDLRINYTEGSWCATIKFGGDITFKKPKKFSTKQEAIACYNHWVTDINSRKETLPIHNIDWNTVDPNIRR